MFQNRENSGFHLICDIHNIQKKYTYEDLYDMMEWIVCLLDVKILNTVSYRFKAPTSQNSSGAYAPDGSENHQDLNMEQSCTILMLLAESHLSIHTYPEMDYIALDLYTCRDYTTDEEYKKVVDFIIYYLDCFITYDILVRGKKSENII